MPTHDPQEKCQLVYQSTPFKRITLIRSKRKPSKLISPSLLQGLLLPKKYKGNLRDFVCVILLFVAFAHLLGSTGKELDKNSYTIHALAKRALRQDSLRQDYIKSLVDRDACQDTHVELQENEGSGYGPQNKESSGPNAALVVSGSELQYPNEVQMDAMSEIGDDNLLTQTLSFDSAQISQDSPSRSSSSSFIPRMPQEHPASYITSLTRTSDLSQEPQQARVEDLASSNSVPEPQPTLPTKPSQTAEPIQNSQARMETTAHNDPVPEPQDNQHLVFVAPVPYPKFDIPGALNPTILPHGHTVGGEFSLVHLFWVPNQNRWQCWDQFPLEFQNRMGTVITESIFLNLAQRRAWAAITRQPGERIDPTRCVASIILSRGSKRGFCKWVISQNDSQSACDTCILKKRPCMRVAMVPGSTDPVIVWSPLPENLRRGVELGNMDYYVM